MEYISNEEANQGGFIVPTIKVMSYNIQKGIGTDRVYRIERIADVIRESGAEVIGLQEVAVHWDEMTDYEHGIRQLAYELGMSFFFAPIYDLPSEKEGQMNRRQFGVGILSKYPIVQAENHPMTRLSTVTPDSEPAPMPGFAEALIDLKGVLLRVYSAHLDFRRDPSLRALQVQEMLEVMSKHDCEKILFSDCNAKPDDTELAQLYSHLYDTWFSVNQEPGHTFPADNPDRKIDYIFASRGIRTIDAAIVPTTASDHRPITAQLEVSS